MCNVLNQIGKVKPMIRMKQTLKVSRYQWKLVLFTNGKPSKKNQIKLLLTQPKSYPLLLISSAFK